MRVHDRQPPGTPDGVMSAPSHRGLLAALLVAQLMVILDISAVKVALPDMAKDLGIRGADVGWVVTSYSLIFGSLLLLGGRAADLLGRRKLFLTGLSIFTVASFASAVSVDASMLFAARAGQGLGAAMLSPAGCRLSPPRSRARLVSTRSALGALWVERALRSACSWGVFSPTWRTGGPSSTSTCSSALCWPEPPSR